MGSDSGSGGVLQPAFLPQSASVPENVLLLEVLGIAGYDPSEFVAGPRVTWTMSLRVLLG